MFCLFKAKLLSFGWVFSGDLIANLVDMTSDLNIQQKLLSILFSITSRRVWLESRVTVRL